MSTDHAPEAAPDRPGRFRYFDGLRDRFGDPLRIQLRLARASPGRDILTINGLLDAFHSPGSAEQPDIVTAGEAMEKLDTIVAAGFDLPPYDEATGAGLLAVERVQLLTAFLVSLAPVEDDHEAETG